MNYQFKAIAFIESCYPEKFGIPKQPQLAPASYGRIVFSSEFCDPSFFRGLEETSHLWVTFVFHQSEDFFQPTVRPPILGGKQRMGVWSTRSPHRPNPIGLSLVRLTKVLADGILEIAGHDLVDGTPILDVKPYIVHHDSPMLPAHHWSAGHVPIPLKVQWDGLSLQALALDKNISQDLVEQVLSQDPRPRSQSDQRSFGLRLGELDILWEVRNQNTVHILSVALWDSAKKIKNKI